jgi:UDP-glucose 4-epimerase
MLVLVSEGDFDREIFNIGNETPTTINELANAVIKASGSTSAIKYIPYADVFSENHADIMRRVPNTEKVREFTGHINKYNLDNIIEDML